MVFNWGKKMAARHEDEEDMTMEEILASIRRYVADDKPASQERSKVSEFKPTQEPQPVTNTIIVEPNPEKTEMQRQGGSRDREDEVIFDLTELVEEGHMSFPKSKSEAASWTQPTTDTRTTQAPVQQPSTYPSTPHTQPLAKEREMHRVPPEDSMTSSQTVQASLSALSRLTEAKRTAAELSSGSGAVTLDRLVADIARPIIKEWLEKNLAPMIERMVAKEIERITREIPR
jgi:cell pole-organizing protein PopZ